MSNQTSVLNEDSYYRLLSGQYSFIECEGDAPHCLRRGAIVLCLGVLTEGGSRFAILAHQYEGGQQFLLKQRVSRFNRGGAIWRELDEMSVIALADKLPTL